MNWLARAAFAALVVCSIAYQSAFSQLGQPGLSGGQGTGTFTPLAGANVDLSFATNQSFGCGATFSSCLSITRATGGTDLLPTSASGAPYSIYGNNTLRVGPSGLISETARTNQLFNSAVPATQTTGSLATGTYTLWVNGSGSATMAPGTATGCGTGAATQGTPVNFTISVLGTCTVTVAGALNAFQLELGAYGSSLIITGAGTGTRNADAITFTTPLVYGTAMSFYSQFTLNGLYSDQRVFQSRTDATNLISFRGWTGADSRADTADGVTAGLIVVGTPVANTIGKSAIAFSLNSLRGARNGVLSTPDTSAGLPSGMSSMPTGVGGSATGTVQLDGVIARATWWLTTAVSDAQLQTFTTP